LEEEREARRVELQRERATFAQQVEETAVQHSELLRSEREHALAQLSDARKEHQQRIQETEHAIDFLRCESVTKVTEIATNRAEIVRLEAELERLRAEQACQWESERVKLASDLGDHERHLQERDAQIRQLQQRIDGLVVAATVCMKRMALQGRRGMFSTVEKSQAVCKDLLLALPLALAEWRHNFELSRHKAQEVVVGHPVYWEYEARRDDWQRYDDFVSHELELAVQDGKDQVTIENPKANKRDQRLLIARMKTYREINVQTGESRRIRRQEASGSAFG